MFELFSSTMLTILGAFTITQELFVLSSPRNDVREHQPSTCCLLRPRVRLVFIGAQAREEMRNPIHGLVAANRIALLRTGRRRTD